MGNNKKRRRSSGPPTPSSVRCVAQAPPPRKALEGQRSAYGTSAGNTDNLQSFSRQTASLNDSMLPHPGKVDAALAAFARSCSWVTFDASSVAAALTAWNKANVDEITWADRVRELFVNAGGTGMAVPNSALDAALQASGISSSRDDIVVDPPTAMGGQPTSGFADDPVNAATGNFVEPQVDLGFTGGSATLEWGRVYNSMSQVCGAFGPGWSSLAESRLVVTDESARWVQADGRHIVFGRMGEGWGRAQCENLWLEQPTGMGGVAFLIRDNDGGSFAFSQAGRPVFQDRVLARVLPSLIPRIASFAWSMSSVGQSNWCGARMVAALSRHWPVMVAGSAMSTMSRNGWLSPLVIPLRIGTSGTNKA